MILQLIDGAIQEITSDSEYYPGYCETCDYGSKYVREFDFKLTTGRIVIKASEEYSYPLSEGYMMTLLLPNATLIQQKSEKEFYEWLKQQVQDDVDTIDWYDFK